MAKRQPITTRKIVSTSRKRRSRSSNSALFPALLALFLITRWQAGLTRRWQLQSYGFLLFFVRIHRWLQHQPARRRTIKVKTKQPTGVIYPVIPWYQRYFFHIGISVIATVLIVGGSVGIYESIFKDLPAPTELTQRQQQLTTKILDRNGNVLFRIYADENRTLVPLSHVSPYLIQATIAIEDQSFYKHYGLSAAGITRALSSNLQGEAVQGGSTITQQLVKMRLLSPERTLSRKIREAILAVLVERTYTKDEILEMYLNQVAYGGSTYGIEEAANRYFSKPATDLTLAESALLAGLPQAPSAYTPFGTTPELAKNRQIDVLRRMVEDGYITQEQADAAAQEELALANSAIEIQAPHFVMYVKQLLAEMYGDEVLNTGGLEVRTTLDLGLQNEAQKKVSEEVNTLQRLRVSNGAALVTNPGTGEVLAMVGSTNYFDFEHGGQVNVTLRPRQPGSSIKPLTYSLALERGLSPSSLIDDTPITYQVAGSKPYSPKNYDGRFHGRVSLREALGSSYNIPAVKLLASLGLNTLIDRAQAMGIDTWGDRSRFGLSLTLGGGEVTMTDMAEMYGTFANLGSTKDLNPLLEVRDAKGKTLYRNTCALDNNDEDCHRRHTLDARVAFQITDILSDNRARTPAFGAQSVLTIPNQQVAVKTGTTNNLHDNWAIGYTTDRLVAVWVGNNDNSPMSYVASGVTGASPIWNNIMRLVLDDGQPHHFATPESVGLLKVAICTKTGTLACSACPDIREEYFVPGTQPTAGCSSEHFAVKPVDTTNPPAVGGATHTPPRATPRPVPPAQQGG